LTKLKPDTLIESPLFPEYVRLHSWEDKGDYIRIKGEGVKTKLSYDRIIPKKEFYDKVKILAKDNFLKEEAYKVFFSLEALRYKYASLYDPLLAVNISKIDPLPHQIEAVYGRILKLPHIRFLIADDPGAGKTIMAGLIIKELKLRGLVRRILIVVPGHLKDQWRRELKEKFDEIFTVVDRYTFNNSYGINPWEKENQIITSMDFAKRDEILNTLASTHFDLVIVDEAHKMSAYKYGEKTQKSDRYKLGEVLSRISEHMLFLTATPHKGDPENFRLFIDLLYPGFFATTDLIEESIRNQDNPLFIRRIKEDLKDFDGKPLFLPRHVRSVPFSLGKESPKEMELYNELSKYVIHQYNLIKGDDKKRNVAFALVILQRRFASSVYALLKSLERRKKRLEEVLNNADSLKDLKIDSIDMEDVEDMSEEERWREESVWETISLAENKEELKAEIQTLEKLINKAKEIIEREEELKLKKLKEVLEELTKNITDPTLRKVIIFTESKDTLDYLEKKIREWGYKVNTIHGGMPLDLRIQEEERFRAQTEILVATEAAGEGINLQFCNLMINYDIPWNPNRLEQRMGRIHRYGQTREVFVYNLIAEDTREGRVLKRILDKLEEIRNVLGSDKVFDVIGEIMDSRKFTQSLVDAAMRARNIEEILAEIEEEIKIDEEYINRVKESLGESLATRHIDFTRIKEMSQKAKENRLIPEYTQNFFLKIFEKLEGKYRILKNGVIAIDSVPSKLRKFNSDEDFLRKYGRIESRYPKITFDKNKAMTDSSLEFVSFGHPLFESAIFYIEKDFQGSLYNGAVFYDPEGKLNGYILFYEGEINDGTSAVAGKRIFAFYVNDQEVREVSPTIIWDLIEENNPNEEEEIDIESLKSKIEPLLISALEKYQEEIFEERKRQAEIKEKYGIRSLEYLINKLNEDLIKLQERKDRGENVDIAIHNKKEKLDEYDRALRDLKEQIEREKTLSLSSPKYLGIIKVKPKVLDANMVSDEEVEKMGMKIAMEYEIKEGRFPEDVSSYNLGFDIRSRDKDGNYRYIEVKARAEEGAIVLTQNEWFKAQNMGDDYYLYVVYNAVSKPNLYIIKNPALYIKPEEKVEVVRFVVDGNEIINKGVKIDF